MSYLLDNPLLAWELQRLRGERRAWLGAVGFAILYYGVIAFVVAVWLGTGGRPQVERLLTTFHYLTWGVSGLLLLLWAPTRLAQNLAREKERGGIDALRLTGLTGLELAVASLVSALTFPLALAITTLPVALLGFGGEVSAGGVLRAYLALFLLAPVYTLLGGLAGLATQKAQHATSAAGLLVIVLLIASGSGLSEPIAYPLGLLGPWGTGLSAPQGELFELPLPGGRWGLPADLVQVPLLVVLGRVLLAGLARRLAGAPALLLGQAGAVAALTAGAVVALVTFSGTGRSPVWHLWYRVSANEELMPRLIVLWFLLLLCAFEAPVAWRDLVRGLARRGPDDPVPPDERLTALRFATGPAVFATWVLLTACVLAALGRPQPIAGFALASAVALASACLAGSAAQAAVLLAHGRPLAWLWGAGAVAGLWFVPLVASGGLRLFELPAVVYELPQAINPLYGMYLACFHGRSTLTSGLSPLALATTCVGWQLAGTAACVALTRTALAAARERADSLVALPADAFAPPGTLDRRCAAGHQFSSAWTSCPHCPTGAAVSAAAAPLPLPTPSDAPTAVALATPARPSDPRTVAAPEAAALPAPSAEAPTDSMPPPEA